MLMSAVAYSFGRNGSLGRDGASCHNRPLGGSKHQAVTRGEVAGHALVRRAIFVTEFLGAIRPHFQIQIDIRIRHFIMRDALLSGTSPGVNIFDPFVIVVSHADH